MKNRGIITLTLILTLLVVGGAAAQAAEGLKLGLNRDFGYGGFNNDIQGLFTMKIVDEPANLKSVDFMIDGEVIFNDTEAPFRYQFTTDNYALGVHTLSAKGVTTDAKELLSNEIVVEFVPASAATGAIGKIIVPILGILAAVMLITFIVPVLLMRRKGASLPLGAPRKFGISGGTICPKCKRAFAMHFFAPNMLAGKLDICPHCGKWSIVRSYPRDVLDASVAAELELGKARGVVSSESEEEKLRRELDESKYHDV